MATSLETIRTVRVVGKSEGLTQVKADLEGVSSAQQNVATSGAQMATVTDSVTRKTLSVADAVERHRRSLDASIRVQEQYDRAQRAINAGIAQGIPDLERYSAINARLHREAMARIEAQRAAQDRAKVSAGFAALGDMGRAALVENDASRRIAGMNAPALAAARLETEQLAAAAAKLRAEINPVGAALDRMNRELAEYDRLASAGAISTHELATAQTMARQRFAVAAGDVTGIGKAAELTTGQITGMTYQLNDVAVSLASGQSPFMVLMQQGMHLGQMFGPGSTLRSAAGAIGTAFLSMLNPINLAVVGLAAAAGGAAYLFRTINDEGEKSEDTLKRHEALIRSFKDAYGEAAKGARDYAAESQAVVGTRLRAGAFEAQARFNAMVPDTLGALGVRSRDRFSPNSEFAVFRKEIEEAGKLALAGKPAFTALYEAVSGRANADPGNAGLTKVALDLFDVIAAAKQAEAQMMALQQAIRLAIPPDTRREAIIDRTQSQRSANQAGGFGIPIPRPSPMKQLGYDPLSAETQAALKLTEQMALEMREAAIESMDQIRTAADGTLSGFVSDLRQGVDLWNALGNAANRVLDGILDRLNSDLIDALLGKRGTTQTGLVGSWFGFGAPTAANSNVAGGPVGAPVGPVTSSPLAPLGAGAAQAAAAMAGGGRALPDAVEATRGTVERYAQQYGVPTDLALAVMAAESRGNQSARSPVGAIGRMQLMPGTAAEMGVNPYDPEQNIAGGVRYLGQQYSRFGGDVNRTLAAYNWGPGRAARWGGDVNRLPAETQGYINTVTGYMPQGGGTDAAVGEAAAAAQTATQSFQQLGGALQATTPQVGGFGQAIASVFGGFFGGGDAVAATSITAGLYHSGGLVGSPSSMRAVNGNVFAGARRMHSGGLAGDEVPAILQRGERVIPAGQAGGGGANIQIIDQRKGGAAIQSKRTMGPDGQEIVRLIVRDENVKSNAPGGLNAKKDAANGIRRPYVQR